MSAFGQFLVQNSCQVNEDSQALCYNINKGRSAKSDNS